MIRRFTSFLLFACLLSVTLHAQELELKAYGVTPRYVNDATIYKSRATGLTNVGVGTLNYIEAKMTGAEFASPAWSLTRFPSGSKATVGVDVDNKDASTIITSFRPDKPGTYEITFTDGAYSKSITFNAANFVGYTNTVIGGTDTKLNCQVCHSDKVDEWKGTGHATIFERAMNGTLSSHYSESCVECHTTGYDEDSLAVNNGFDDFDFEFPATLEAGKYDELVTEYPDAMLRANIQCEDCHGPASGHLGNTQDSRMEASFAEEVCASCHDEGTHHIFPEEWLASGHAVATDHAAGPGRESCVRCHTGKGFAQYTDGVSTSDPYFDPSYVAITCAACHDPHDATNAHQLRSLETELTSTDGSTTIKVDESNAGMGAMCINCHQSRAQAVPALAGSINSRFGPHHGPQGDILFSNNLLELGGVTLAQSNHLGATGDACVTCHMFTGNSVTGSTINQLGGHSFSMYNYKKDANGDFLLDADGNRIKDQDNMAACAQCHGNTFGTTFKDVKFFMNGTGDFDGDGVASGLQNEVEGMINKIMDKIEATEGSTTPSSSWTQEDLSAYWNAETVISDASYGIHNPKYIVTGLLGAMKSIGIVTAVNDEVESIPTEYTLYQNFPNPFNPTTNIRFSLPQSSNVKVVIYDAIGKQVQTLVNNELNAGIHTISWNAEGLASGIYLCRIEAGNFVQVNKMLLLK